MHLAHAPLASSNFQYKVYMAFPSAIRYLSPLGEMGVGGKLASNLLNNQEWSSTSDLVPPSTSSEIIDMYYHILFKLLKTLFFAVLRIELGSDKMTGKGSS